MTQINIFISLLTLFTYLIIMCFGAPAVTEEEEVIYDQRQNGTENLQIHINGIAFVHAPAEALVALATLTEDSALQQQLMNIIAGSATSSTSRPSTTTTTTTEGATTSELSVTSSADESTSSASTDGTSTTGTSEKPASSESTKPPKKTKGRLRLTSLLMPFLRRL